MKIYIVGSVGSGKSTLARKISQKLNIPAYHLDEVVHRPDAAKFGNTRRSDTEIEQIFRGILAQESFIIEDTLRDRFTVALQQVDKVIFLDISRKTLYARIIKRWLKQKLKIESSSYQPSLQVLRLMFTWVKESPRVKLVNLSNLTVLKNEREVKQFLEKL